VIGYGRSSKPDVAPPCCTCQWWRMRRMPWHPLRSGILQAVLSRMSAVMRASTLVLLADRVE
jgi:hypothetical protein